MYFPRQFSMGNRKKSTDIYEALKFLHIIAKPMGMMVWTLVGSSGCIGRKFAILKKDIFLSVLITTTVISLYGFYLYKCPFYFHKLTTFSYVLLQYKNLAILIIFLCFSLWHSKKFLAIVNEVHFLDGKIQVLTGKPVRVAKLQCLFVTFTAALVILYAVQVFFGEKSNLLKLLRYDIGNYYYCPYVSHISQIFLMLFYSFMVVLMQHLKEQIVSLNQNLGEPARSTFILRGKISKVRVIYNLLLDIYKKINIAFSTPLVLIIVINFLNILSSLYFITGKEFVMLDSTIMNYADLIMWIFLNVLEIFIILYPFITLHDEGKKTIELMENIQTTVSRNSIAYKQIQLFSVQMYLENFKFSVFGYFPLDWTLLHSMVAGITTYLIIFYQFSNLDRGANNPNDIQ